METFLQEQYFTTADKGGSDILCPTQYQQDIATDSEITAIIKSTANVDWVLYFTEEIWEYMCKNENFKLPNCSLFSDMQNFVSVTSTKCIVNNFGD